MKKVIPKPESNLPFSVRIKPSIVAALKEAAEADGRTISKETEIALGQWLKERGFLK